MERHLREVFEATGALFFSFIRGWNVGATPNHYDQNLYVRPAETRRADASVNFPLTCPP